MNRGTKAVITFVDGICLHTLDADPGQVCPSLVSRQLMNVSVAKWQPLRKYVLNT
jgi:hypothetical protein